MILGAVIGPWCYVVGMWYLLRHGLGDSLKSISSQASLFDSLSILLVMDPTLARAFKSWHLYSALRSHALDHELQLLRRDQRWWCLNEYWWAWHSLCHYSSDDPGGIDIVARGSFTICLRTYYHIDTDDGF